MIFPNLELNIDFDYYRNEEWMTHPYTITEYTFIIHSLSVKEFEGEIITYKLYPFENTFHRLQFLKRLYKKNPIKNRSRVIKQLLAISKD